MTVNRIRENRPSGMIGGLAETWTMVEAIRAHKAETPKHTSFNLRLRALLGLVELRDLNSEKRVIMKGFIAKSCARVVVAVIALLLACTSPTNEVCLPPGMSEPVPSLSSEVPLSSSTNVYIDASGSMLGFVRSQPGGTDTEQTYVDLVRALPHLLSQFGDELQFHKFGQDIVTLGNDLTTVVQPSFYKEQESRINEVLGRMNGAPSEALFVILTDLFLSNEELVGTRANALQLPLAQALRAGRSISLLGIRSSFNGYIYDLPQGWPIKHKYVGSRPFFVVMIGPLEKILRLQQELDKVILSVLPEDTHHLALFTNKIIRNPLTGAAWSRDTFTASEGVRQQGDLLIRGARWIQQFRVARDHKPLLATIPLRDLQSPFTIPISKVVLYQELWMDRGEDRRCEGRWFKLSDRPLATASLTGEGIEFSLLGSEDPGTRSLPKARSYLLSVRAKATALKTETQAMAWLREWSLDPGDRERLISNSHVEFFPTLNLARLAGVLEAISSGQYQPQTIAEFTLAFYLEE